MLCSTSSLFRLLILKRPELTRGPATPGRPTGPLLPLTPCQTECQQLVFTSCHFSLSGVSGDEKQKTHWCSSFAHFTRQSVCSRDSLSEETNMVDLDSQITCSNFFSLFKNIYSCLQMYIRSGMFWFGLFLQK